MCTWMYDIVFLFQIQINVIWFVVVVKLVFYLFWSTLLTTSRMLNRKFLKFCKLSQFALSLSVDEKQDILNKTLLHFEKISHIFACEQCETLNWWTDNWRITGHQQSLVSVSMCWSDGVVVRMCAGSLTNKQMLFLEEKN